MAASSVDITALIRDHQSRVWWYLRLLGAGDAEADDLTQDVFTEVLSRPFEDRGFAASGAYLKRAARSRFISFKRRQKRWSDAPSDGSEADVNLADALWESFEPDEGNAELLEALEKCLGKLAERARRAIEMRFRQDSPRSEIARTLEISEVGVTKLLQRGKAALRECIEKRTE